MHAQQTNQREVTKGLVKLFRSVLASDTEGILTSLNSLQLLLDVGLARKRIKNVQDAVSTPAGRVVLEQVDLLGVVSTLNDFVAVDAESVELVDKLVNDIPGPVARELLINGTLGVQNVIEKLAVVLV